MMIPQHPDREEIMASMDGELTAERDGAIRDHMAGCQQCARWAAELRGTRDALTAWQVEPMVIELPATGPKIAGWIPLNRRWILAAGALAGAAALIVVLGVTAERRASLKAGTSVTGDLDSLVGRLDESRRSQQGQIGERMGRGGIAGQPIAAPSEAPIVAPVAESETLIARTAQLDLVVTNVDQARAAIEREAAARRGTIARLDLGGEGSVGRMLSVTVKVPAASLTDSLTIFRRLGRVAKERHASEDVTSQSIDLNARLANARHTEERMVAVLANRTGKITDVLEVERELARVRGEIEEMEAVRAQLAGRVAMATIDLTVTEEHRAAAAPATPSISGDLANAFRDGVRQCLELVLDTAKFILVAGPTVILCAALLGVPLFFWRRRRSSAHLL